jgi:hypothetical protein
MLEIREPVQIVILFMIEVIIRGVRHMSHRAVTHVNL